MKKFVLTVTLIISAALFAQSEELLKMYETLTGKDLTEELEMLRSSIPRAMSVPGDSLSSSYNPGFLPYSSPFSPLGFVKNEPESVIVKSYFEKYVSGELIDPYKSELKQFKVDFASVTGNTNNNRPVPDNYLIHEGDVFKIDVWGAMEKNYSPVVSKEYFIILPQIGKIDLSGMNYGQARNAIESKLSNINGIKYSVIIGSVKPISVFVVGNVHKPGVYNVSPFASLIEVLAAAGGVKPEGSLRTIGLISETSGRKFVDMYSLLFFGKNPVSVLESNMTIFVPLIGKQVAVAGNVKLEGIYESLPGEDLKSILEIAGMTPFSDSDRIEIEKLDKNGRSEISSVSLKDNPKISDGDVIRIFSTMVFNSKYVYLKGNFRHNKKIQFKDGMTLGDIFSDPDVLFENTETGYANIIRKNGMGQRDLMINFSPKNAIEKGGDDRIALFSRDTVEVFSIDSISYFPSVMVSGEINRSGSYKFTKDMTVSNLLSYSGGLTSRGDKNNIIVIRNKASEGFEYFSDIDPDSFILSDRDRVHIFDFFAKNPLQGVKIFGHVKKEGSYIHSPGMTAYDLIGLAGGLKNDALSDSVEVVSGINKDNKDLRSKWYSREMLKTAVLNPNDIVFVRRIKDFAKVNYVKIFGQVLFPGVYAMKENETLAELMEKCGGFTSNAHKKSMQIFREEVRQKQQAKISDLRNELQSKLQLQMALTGNSNIAGALNVAKFDSIRANGRVVLQIDEKGSHDRFYLHDLDSIFVPTVSSTVYVMGEVFKETALTFNPKKAKVKHYLEKAGGTTLIGDKKNLYVIKSNGELVSRPGWFSTGMMSYEVEPGDIIYVPYNYDRISFIQMTKDISTILYQLSLSAASIYQISR
jgi:polysaccharide biosynthesis/export protein